MTATPSPAIAAMTEAARYIAPGQMPDANAGRKRWGCLSCGNVWATVYTRDACSCAHCGSSNLFTEETE